MLYRCVLAYFVYTKNRPIMFCNSVNNVANQFDHKIEVTETNRVHNFFLSLDSLPINAIIYWECCFHNDSDLKK